MEKATMSGSGDPTVRVLFLCVGNSCRSQMAEAFLRSMAPGGVEALSAGSAPAEAVHPLAVELMRKDYGLDLSAHRPKHVREFAGHRIDFAVTTCDEAWQTCPVFPTARERLHWPLEDPAAAVGSKDERLEACRIVANELRTRIERDLLPRIEAFARERAPRD